jgi:uncharacterized protein (DUF305 family)
MDAKPKDKKISGQRKFIAFLILLLFAVSLSLLFFKEKPAGALSQSEINFLTMMIPHHEQAVTMSELALTNTTNPEVRALATAIRDAQGPEIVQMQKWLGDKGGVEAHSHGMEMGGMLSAEELETLASLKGEAFDQYFLASMIAHHEGALDMVEMINDSTNSEVKTLAANIVKSQSAEIEAMKALLK